MNVVKELYDKTIALHQILQEWPDKENREAYIESVETLLDARQELMEKLSGPYSESEQQLGRKIIELNEEVESKLHHFQAEIGADLQSLRKGKVANKNYANPYATYQSGDGMFFDKRK